jgi:hypothetical protein
MLITTKKELINLLKSHQETINKFGINKLGIFGSFVRDEVNQDSDVDILVTFKPEQKTFDNYMDLAFFLEDILGRKIDLITQESLSCIFGDKILKEVEYVEI